MKRAVPIGLALLLPVLAACEPEVGSKDWCAEMQEKPKGDWTINETSDFTKHCLIDALTGKQE
ncbi:MAG: DUF3012 domain-containing protein [Minwuia sp.]|uniref:DUF3012 domain-containing protein n=1 Tax=Minwuia sp. TaxID=2493630 RepID=UPI003A84D5DC